MKKIHIIIRYIIGVFLISLSIFGGVFDDSIFSGLLLIVSGIILLPLLDQYFVKMKIWMKYIVAIFLFIFAIVLTPEIDYENTIKLDSPQKAEVTIIDFSEMTIDNISNWCEENKVECYKRENYSNDIEKGKFINQSVQSGDKIKEGSTVEIIYSLGKEPTPSQKNALKTAESYLRSSSFSYKGLVSQLEYEEYNTDDAIWAVDNVEVDWNEQAYKKAKSYLRSSSFSLNSLIGQLEYEKFTKEQAKYGAERAYEEQ